MKPARTPTTVSPPKFWIRFPYLIIILLGFILYAHTLKYDYTNLDDKTLIADDKEFVSKLSNIPEAFKLDVFKEMAGTFYRPLFVTSLIIDGSLGKMSFTVYHFSNILFHLLSACLLFSLLIKLRINKSSSLLLVLFFVVHPALMQAVAWIPGRNDSLLAVFVLSSFIMLMNYIQSKKTIHFVLHTLFFIMAMFTKETAIVLPVLYLLMLRIFGKEKLFSKSTILFFVSWLVLLIVWFVARKNAIQTSQGTTPLEFLSNIPRNLPSFFIYVGKILLPFNLSVMPTVADSTIIFGIISIIVIPVLFFISKTKFTSLAVFGSCWFVLFIIPVFLVPQASAFFYEQRLYLPLMGLLIIFGQLVIDTTNQKRIKYFNSALVVLTICFLPINIMYSKNFSDKIIFWDNAIATSPNSAYVEKIAASVYYINNNPEKAKTCFIKALEANPNELAVNNDLGVIYRDRKEWDQAIACFEREIALDAVSEKAYYNLGFALYSTNKKEEAVKKWEKVVELSPEYKDVYQSLALVNAELKNFERARYYAAEATKHGIDVPKDFLKAIGAE